MIKAFLCALVLTFRELRNFPTDKSKTKQQERPIGCIVYMYFTAKSYLLVECCLRTVYICISVGLSVARFDLSGNAKAF